MTVGVRLVEGGIAFEAGLTVLVLAPELYLPLRNLAAQFHASADGLAVTDRLLELIDVPEDPRLGVAAAPPSPRMAPVRLEGVSFSLSLPARRRARCRVDLELAAGQTVALAGRAAQARAPSPRCSCASPSRPMAG